MGARWGEIQRGVSLSRREEREGRLTSLPEPDPGYVPDRGWNQRDEPTAAELLALEHDDLEQAA